MEGVEKRRWSRRRLRWRVGGGEERERSQEEENLERRGVERRGETCRWRTWKWKRQKYYMERSEEEEQERRRAEISAVEWVQVLMRVCEAWLACEIWAMLVFNHQVLPCLL